MKNPPHWCKRCIVRPICQTPCDKINKLVATLNYFGDKILLWTLLELISSVVICMILDINGYRPTMTYVVCITAFVTFILVGIYFIVTNQHKKVVSILYNRN